MLASLGNALVGTVNPVLQSTIDDVVDFFGDNIGAVIAGLIAIALVLWFISLFFRATGAKKKSL